MVMPHNQKFFIKIYRLDVVQIKDLFRITHRFRKQFPIFLIAYKKPISLSTNQHLIFSQLMQYRRGRNIILINRSNLFDAAFFIVETEKAIAISANPKTVIFIPKKRFDG